MAVCGVAWRGVVWWCGVVVWCGVLVWCGVVDMDDDLEVNLVVLVLECQKRDSQTDTQTAQLYI